MTAVAGTVFTAAQWNACVRNNLNACAPAIATAGARWLVSTGFNSLTEREPQVEYLSTTGSTTSSSYGDLDTLGPLITTTTSSKVMVTIGAHVNADTSRSGGKVSVEVSGATSLAATDSNCFFATAPVSLAPYKGTWTTLFDEHMVAGENTFTLKYRLFDTGTCYFSNRLLVIMSF
jgi:hypothetical protein